MAKDVGRVGDADQALTVPAEPVSRLGPTGFDPSRKGGLRNLVALVIDANYHTAISKALSTADQIIEAIEANNEGRGA